MGQAIIAVGIIVALILVAGIVVIVHNQNANVRQARIECARLERQLGTARRGLTLIGSGAAGNAELEAQITLETLDTYSHKQIGKP